MYARRWLSLGTLMLTSFAGCDAESPRDTAAVPTLADIQPNIFKASCAFGPCHGGPNPKNGLDLSSVDGAWASLIDVPSRSGNKTRVIPGDPDASLLAQVLDGPVDGVRQMPPGFDLPQESKDAIRAWIAAGAPRGDGTVTPPSDVIGGGGDVVTDPDAPTPLDLPAPAPGLGFQMGIDTEAAAGAEIWKCVVADLPTEDFSAVSRVESLQSRGVHHMDVMALGLLDLPIEPGLYDCDDLYSTYPELMEDGIFLFASQNERESLQLPTGTVALIPAGLRVMVEVHYVNPLPHTAPVWSRINAWTIPMEEMTNQIWGSAVRTVEIDIPPATERHYEWVRCEMNEDVEMVILSSHTHQLAEYVDVYLWDGTSRGEMVYENYDWHAPTLKQFDPPVTIKKGTGFEFRCHYRNKGDKNVRWGFGADDEMCQIGLVHTPFLTTASCVVTQQGRGPELPE